MWSMYARRRLRASGHRAHALTGVLGGAPDAACVLTCALPAYTFCSGPHSALLFRAQLSCPERAVITQESLQ